MSEWETIAAAVAVVLALGSVFYYIVSIEKDVERIYIERIYIESQKQKKDISKNNDGIEKNKDRIVTLDKGISSKIAGMDSTITAIQKDITESSEDIRMLLTSALNNEINE